MKEFDKKFKFNTTEPLTKEQSEELCNLAIDTGNFSNSCLFGFDETFNDRITFSNHGENPVFFFDSHAGGCGLEITFEQCKSILEKMIAEKESVAKEEDKLMRYFYTTYSCYNDKGFRSSFGSRTFSEVGYFNIYSFSEYIKTNHENVYSSDHVVIDYIHEFKSKEDYEAFKGRGG